MGLRKNKSRYAAILLTLTMAAGALAGCGDAGTENQTPQGENQTSTEAQGGLADILMDNPQFVKFKPSECGIWPEEKYDFAYLGLSMVLTDSLLEQITSHDVLMQPYEDYNFQDGTMKYAMIKWYKLTQEQKDQEFEAYDPQEWEAGLEKIGTLGVYHKDMLGELDSLSGCTNHTELGKSADGEFIYYLSIADGADETLKQELENSEIAIREMKEMDIFDIGTAFAAERLDVTNVGKLQMQDINGESYTEEMFADADLTLVNVFATWCTPCVEEMPELEELKQQMEAMGVKVAAVVADTVTPEGKVDENALEKAKMLQEKLGLTFPLLMPDETLMNGRLQGIEAFPETFFVDKNGNIVGEKYVGAGTMEEWKEIVEKELANLNGENK